MSDEELDKLFRESAERHEPPFDPEAWKAKDRELDGAQGIVATAKRLLPVLVLALVVLVATDVVLLVELKSCTLDTL